MTSELQKTFKNNKDIEECELTIFCEIKVAENEHSLILQNNFCTKSTQLQFQKKL